MGAVTCRHVRMPKFRNHVRQHNISSVRWRCTHYKSIRLQLVFQDVSIRVCADNKQSPHSGREERRSWRTLERISRAILDKGCIMQKIAAAGLAVALLAALGGVALRGEWASRQAGAAGAAQRTFTAARAATHQSW